MHEGLKEIAGTKFIISGRRLLDLNEPESMDLIVRKGVKQVFMIFMGEVLDKGYSEHKQEIEQKLIERGIQFIPLPKDPENIGPLEAFSRNVSKLKPNEKALVQCYHGLHNSGAYVAYQLLKEGIGFGRVHETFSRTGWSDGSIGTIKIILNNALKSKGINIMKFSQAWERVSIERAKLAGRKELEKRAANHAESMKRFKEFLAKVGEQRRIKPKL